MKKYFFYAVLTGIGFFLSWVFYPVIFAGDKITNILYPNTVFLDTNGEVFYTLPKERLFYQTPLNADQIDDNFLILLITKEDENFYSHFGVDIPKKVFLLAQYITGSSSRGGSTITEQWLKNKYFRETPRTFPQKIRESILAGAFSLITSKKEIITEYINIAYFGRGAYGIEAASNQYFNKSFATLNFLEKSFLLSCLSSPNAEENNLEKFREYRKQYFLDIARQKKLLSDDLLEQYTNQNLKILPKNHTTFRAQEENYILAKDVIALAQYDLTEENIDTANGGVQVFTAFNTTLQKDVSRIVETELSRLSYQNVQNAGVVILNAQTGGIISLVSHTKNSPKAYQEMNTVLVKRPIASTIKPFLYLFAFLEGRAPNDTIVDTQEEFLISQPGEETEYYVPHNFNGKEYGEVTLAEALANSLNISTVKLLDELGIENFYQFLKNIGFMFAENSDFYGLSLSLGTNDESLLKMTSLMSIFVHSGEYISPHIITKTTDEKTEQQRVFQSNRHQVLSGYSKEEVQNATQNISEILRNPAYRQKVFYLAGTLGNNHGFSVKTGTSANFKDNWTMGFNDKYIVGVWTGNLENSPMQEVAGVDGAAVIWREVIEILNDQ